MLNFVKINDIMIGDMTAFSVTVNPVKFVLLDFKLKYVF